MEITALGRVNDHVTVGWIGLFWFGLLYYRVRWV